MSGIVRQKKFGRLIQKELSDILQRNQQKFLNNFLITITEVLINTDLSFAKVYFSMSLVKDPQAVLEKLELHKKEIRKALGAQIKNQTRIIPSLAFFIDDLEDNARQIDELINQINIPPKTP